MEPRAFKDAVFEQFARAASAFASPKRLEIIDLLSQSERSVESIATAASMTVANTSQHLQVLKSAGMVSAHRDGTRITYCIADDAVVEGYRSLQQLAEMRIPEVARLATEFFGADEPSTPVSIDELLERMRTNDAIIIDVRPSLEYRAGHLPGAINVPLDALSEWMRSIPQNAHIVAYCRGPYCVLAAQATTRLREAGLSAKRLNGGPTDWTARNLELQRTP